MCSSSKPHCLPSHQFVKKAPPHMHSSTFQWSGPFSLIGKGKTLEEADSSGNFSEYWKIKPMAGSSTNEANFAAKTNQVFFWIQCSDSVLIYYRERKEMDSSAGQHRLSWGCRCKDDRVQPSLGLRVSAKYIHSAHAFFAFLGNLIFLMGMIKVSRCFGLEILILNHPW